VNVMSENRLSGLIISAIVLSLWPSIVAANEPAPPLRKPDLSGFVQLAYGSKMEFGVVPNFMAFGRGRWEGDGVPYKNNLALIDCRKADMRCLISSIEQIGPQQIGSLTPSTEMKITKWDNKTVSADFIDTGAPCLHLSITLHIQEQAAEYVFDPINSDREHCKRQKQHRMVWHMTDPLDR
jgi:hypothetical protein